MIACLFDCSGVYCSHRVQEQENQKRKLCDELEQLKTPQDSREASCQTPVPEEEVRQEVDSRAQVFRPEKKRAAFGPCFLVKAQKHLHQFHPVDKT